MAEPINDYRGNILIIGASAAGVSAAREIRKVNRTAQITVITEEQHYPYYRPLLIRRIADESVEQNPAFPLNTETWYHENAITFLPGERVTRIDPDQHTAFTEKNRVLPWDRLILATGSRPFVPVPGALEKENVFAIRTLDDARAVYRAQKTAERVVVIGGGLLGLETADELLKAGKKVFVVEMAERILPIQLDPEGSAILEKIIKEKNCVLYLGDLAEKLIGEKRVSEVQLKSGKELPADMVVFSIGVRANLDLPKTCGLKTNRATLVNDRMETSIPGIFACGDVAEHTNYVCLWMPAIRQGAVAGLNAIGESTVFKTEDYPASMMSFGTRIFSVGDLGRKESIDTYFQEKRIHSGRGIYQKLYFLEGKLVGGVFIGDNRKVQALVKGVRDGWSGDEAEKLLEE